MNSRAQRAERRAWIRRAHPDRGGDPAEFAAKLAELDGPDGSGGSNGSDQESDRYDGPITGVRRRRGLALFTSQVSTWRRRRRRNRVL